MLAAVFFVLVVALLTGHYFLIERPRRIAAASSAPLRALPVRELIARLPAGVFLQPTFTWGQVRPDGSVEIGVHPMLVSMLGPDTQSRTRSAGERVAKGDPLLTVGSEDRNLVVRSPVDGYVIRADAAPSPDTAWQIQSDRTCWIKPDQLAAEVPTWMIGSAAIDWTRTQYGRIRDHLLAQSADPGMGIALADGGELPVGALNQLDEAAWAIFEDEFLGG